MSAQSPNVYRVICYTFWLITCLTVSVVTAAACTAEAKYCSRQGQNTNTSQRTPLPANKVPEAATGFQDPLNGVRFSTNPSGNRFAEKDTVSYPNCGTIYHPGVDLNWGRTNQDCGSSIGSIADGVVVWIGRNSDWQGLMVQHKYKGEMILAAYGHVVEISNKLSVGDTVKKGQYLAKVGSVGSRSCHLHMEIRNVHTHPDPMNGTFFCRNNREKDVKAWYQDPEPFIDSHNAYSIKPEISLIAPSRVRRKGLRTYEFTVGVQERGGMPVNIDKVYIDEAVYTGRSFFGTSRLMPHRSLTRTVRLQRFLLREQKIPYTVKVWNSAGNRWDTWTKNIVLQPW